MYGVTKNGPWVKLDEVIAVSWRGDEIAILMSNGTEAIAYGEMDVITALLAAIDANERGEEPRKSTL